MICNVLCNLHTISNNCAKYEHPWSINEEEVGVTSHKLFVIMCPCLLTPMAKRC